jgi:hypothetical protein
MNTNGVTASASNSVKATFTPVYFNPFSTQPWRFLWWLDDLGHRKLPRDAHRRLLGWLCDGLDRQFY